MAEVEPKTLKDMLKKMNVRVADINKFTTYINGEMAKEAAAKKKDSNAYAPVTNNDSNALYTLFVKFWNLGLVIDGVNVVITGRNMAMVTYHGFKNKVKSIYPDATFDVQLVREGDTFQVSKESGSVMYSHQFGDPFTEKPIKGAYCIIKIGDSDYLETLNKKDYLAMRGGSKNSGTWDKWESEFWLKSVIKRACKRHFNDITVELDKVDNDAYGLTSKNLASDTKQQDIIKAAKENANLSQS